MYISAQICMVLDTIYKNKIVKLIINKQTTGAEFQLIRNIIAYFSIQTCVFFLSDVFFN